MNDKKLKQTIRDAAEYAKDARAITRYGTPTKKPMLVVTQVRLVAARNAIDRALEEINDRLSQA